MDEVPPQQLNRPQQRILFQKLVKELMPMIEKSKALELVEVNDSQHYLDVEVRKFYNRYKNEYQVIDTTLLTREEYDNLFSFLRTFLVAEMGWKMEIRFDDAGYDVWNIEKGQPNYIVVALTVTKKGLEILEDQIERRRFKNRFESFVNGVSTYLKELFTSKQPRQLANVLP